jgi:hypothetical protein
MRKIILAAAVAALLCVGAPANRVAAMTVATPSALGVAAPELKSLHQVRWGRGWGWHRGWGWRRPWIAPVYWGYRPYYHPYGGYYRPYWGSRPYYWGGPPGPYYYRPYYRPWGPCCGWGWHRRWGWHRHW